MNFIKCCGLFSLVAFCLLGSACSIGESDIIGISDMGEPKITYCLNRYITSDETISAYEVFTGKEATYGKLIMRTQPNNRAGMYFFVMFGYKPDDIALGCTFELSVNTTAEAKTRTYKFTVPETHSVTREVVLGITGSDWKSPKTRVNAWKLVLKSPTGKVLAEKQSWLWAEKQSDSSKIDFAK